LLYQTLIFHLVTRLKDNKPSVLTIAGFDPSSGAGITADLKTIAALGLYGVSCITCLTVQTTQGVLRTETVRPEMVRETLAALADDTSPIATKIGVLGSAEVAATVSEFLKTNALPHVVLDPVLQSSSGAPLLDRSGIDVLKGELLSLAEVITPNLDEAAVLSGMQVTDESGFKQAAKRLHELGAKNVVIKGGHLPQPVDFLSQLGPGGGVFSQSYAGVKVQTANTHGTGCAFSTALACNLGRGIELPEAVRAAKEYVAAALRNSYSIGKGPGPVNHLFSFED
jgi:hydroxymethylpyrimidine/phosphomethylpyrimidine kinase